MNPPNGAGDLTPEELVENPGGRYVLIGTDADRADLRFTIFDVRGGTWIVIDENDRLAREVKQRMLDNGARVYGSTAEAKAASAAQP